MAKFRLNRRVVGQHNYQTKLARLIAEGKIPVVAGTVASVGIAHDDDCSVYQGGLCDCDPDVLVNGKAVNA